MDGIYASDDTFQGHIGGYTPLLVWPNMVNKSYSMRFKLSKSEVELAGISLGLSVCRHHRSLTGLFFFDIHCRFDTIMRTFVSGMPPIAYSHCRACMAGLTGRIYQSSNCVVKLCVNVQCKTVLSAIASHRYAGVLASRSIFARHNSNRSV